MVMSEDFIRLGCGCGCGWVRLFSEPFISGACPGVADHGRPPSFGSARVPPEKKIDVPGVELHYDAPPRSPVCSVKISRTYRTAQSKSFSDGAIKGKPHEVFKVQARRWHGKGLPRPLKIPNNAALPFVNFRVAVREGYAACSRVLAARQLDKAAHRDRGGVQQDREERMKGQP